MYTMYIHNMYLYLLMYLIKRSGNVLLMTKHKRLISSVVSKHVQLKLYNLVSYLPERLPVFCMVGVGGREITLHISEQM